MCGLWGWQWAKDKRPSKDQRRQLAKLLAEANDSRGGQSWGVWSKDLVIRGLGKAEPNSPRFADLQSMFGHSRWATHGGNTIENAHPFVQNGVALSHNGVISNHTALNTKYSRGHSVDSQHILSQLVEGKPFTELQAYGAIVWATPQQPDSIYIGRLAEHGDMCPIKTEFGMVWSSDKNDLKKILKKLNIGVLTRYGVDPGKVYYCEGGEMYVDSSAPSILVSAPPVYRHFSDYGTGFGGQSYTPSTTLWCNLHKSEYSNSNICKCSNHHDTPLPHVLTIPMWAKPKNGETYTVPPFPCSHSTCMRARAGDTKYCTTHSSAESRKAPATEEDTAANIDAVNSSTSGSVNPHTLKKLCTAHSCYGASVTGTERCGKHATVSGIQYPCRAIMCAKFIPKQSSYCEEHRLMEYGYERCEHATCKVWVRDTPTCVAHAPSANFAKNARAETNAELLQLKKDLAGWWLEGHMKEPVPEWMTEVEVLDLAIAEGFNPDEAIALNASLYEPKQEQTDANPSPEAGVQKSKGKHESAHGGGVGALDPRPTV